VEDEEERKKIRWRERERFDLDLISKGQKDLVMVTLKLPICRIDN